MGFVFEKEEALGQMCADQEHGHSSNIVMAIQEDLRTENFGSRLQWLGWANEQGEILHYQVI